MYKRYAIDHTITHSEEEQPASVLDQLAFLRRSAEVNRYHTETTLRPQNIGHHSYGVAWLCYMLSGGDPSRNLLLAALAHDAAEHSLGDIPSPTKRLLGIKPQVDALESQHMASHGVRMPQLHPDEERILQMADALDGVLYCVRELELGNRTLKQVYINFARYAGELNPQGRAKTILEYANDRFQALGGHQ